MNILAFDTCLDKMYVSLSKNDDVLPSKIVETTKEHYHSAFLISTIRDILCENGLTPQDVEVIVTNIGPGSFTGIRACSTVARVFAQGINGGKCIKTIGISSLELLSKLNQIGTKKTLVALDARKESAYAAVYDNRKQIMPPQVILLEDLKEMIAKEDYFIVTDDKLETILGGISYQQKYKNSEDDLGKYLIEIAREKLTQGSESDWRKLYPLYIQPPPITIKKNN